MTCSALLRRVELLQRIAKDIVFHCWSGIVIPWLSITDIAKQASIVMVRLVA